MANAIYPLYKNALMQAAASVKLDGGTTATNPFCVLCSETYVYSPAHQFYSPSVTGIIGTAQEMTSPTVGVVAAGVFDANNVTFTAVTGAAVTQLVFHVANAGANTTWRLFLFEDTGVTGLPVTPNGGDITVTFNASGVFLL